jgi:hypothetical protein
MEYVLAQEKKNLPSELFENHHVDAIGSIYLAICGAVFS